MILNDARINAVKYWNEILEHFTNVKLHEYVFIRNHLHGVIVIDYLPDWTNDNRVKNVSSLLGALVGISNWECGHPCPRPAVNAGRERFSTTQLRGAGLLFGKEIIGNI